MKSLLALCGGLLLKIEFSTDTCLQLLVLASSCELNLLMNCLVSFIADNFQTVKQQEHVLDLPNPLLCRILSESSLNVPDERQVLDVVLKWLHRGKRRWRFAAQLLKCVRWTTVELSAQEWRQLETDEAIHGNEGAFCVVQQAVISCISPAHRCSLSSRVRMPRLSTAERHVLATIGFYGACVWMEEEEEWLQTRFRVDMGSSGLVGMFEHWHRYLDTVAVTYDRRLFMILFKSNGAHVWGQNVLMMEDSKIIVAPVKHRQLQASWISFFCETKGKTSSDFWYSKDNYDMDGYDGLWVGGRDDDDDEIETDSSEDEDEDKEDEDDDSDDSDED